MAAYRRNVTDAADILLDNDPLCTALLALLEASKNYWRGTPATLLGQLRAWAPDGSVQERNWPRSPQALSSRLRLTMPSLRKRQILISKGKSNGERYIELTRGLS
jgi:hypothetical protein